MRISSSSLILPTLLLAFATAVAAQDSAGPMAPPPKFEVKRIPSEPHPGPPPVPEQVIIQKFSANEEVMMQKFETFDYTQTIRIDELAEPGGKFTVTGEVYTRPDGQRYMRVDKQPEASLKVEMYTLEDVRTISNMPLFVFTPQEIANYNFKYVGQEKLDQLNTYIFQVKPKLLSRKRRFFEGVIWIDDQDFVIVKTYGKFVSEISGNGTSLPFNMFETYRENFQGKYWLPTYTRSDDYIKGSDDQEVPVRLIIRCKDFKPHAAEAGPAASQAIAPAAMATPQSPAPPAPPKSSPPN